MEIQVITEGGEINVVALGNRVLAVKTEIKRKFYQNVGNLEKEFQVTFNPQGTKAC